MVTEPPVSMPSPSLIIRPLRDITVLVDLLAEADAGGCGTVSRLIEDWLSGRNRFAGRGEQLSSASIGGVICGVVGLNIDPLGTDNRVGRVRRMYVSTTIRRRGVGTALIDRLVRDAAGHFIELRLRTNDSAASAFYRAVGFEEVSGIDQVTHRRTLPAVA